MGCDIDLRNMAPRQRGIGNPTRSHRGRIRNLHQQTWSRDTAEQKMEKSDQLGTMRMRTSGCSVDLSQQTTDYLGECVHAAQWLSGPSSRENIQNDTHDDREGQEHEDHRR